MQIRGFAIMEVVNLIKENELIGVIKIRYEVNIMKMEEEEVSR